MHLAAELTTADLADLHPSARLVYAVLRSDGPMTRTELATSTGVSPGHVSTVVRELRSRGVVGEQPASRDSPAHRQCYAIPPDR